MYNLIDICDKHLESLHYQLFPSYGWNIKDPTQRKEAAEWLAGQFEAVEHRIMEEFSDDSS